MIQRKKTIIESGQEDLPSQLIEYTKRCSNFKVLLNTDKYG